MNRDNTIIDILFAISQWIARPEAEIFAGNDASSWKFSCKRTSSILNTNSVWVLLLIYRPKTLNLVGKPSPLPIYFLHRGRRGFKNRFSAWNIDRVLSYTMIHTDIINRPMLIMKKKCFIFIRCHDGSLNRHMRDETPFEPLQLLFIVQI